ncbi:MAG: hypothetical protein ACI837_001065 [Crocinitomicaceae bacterium]|jgi:hypothetical protein
MRFNVPKNVCLPLLSLLLPILGWSQLTYDIGRIDEELKIDGELSESIWAKADIATDFTTSYPEFGIKSIHESIVRLCYDDNAFYVSGEMHDNPDSVSYTLAQRDDWGNADWFAITVDPYANNIGSFMFSVSSTGVEIDALLSIDGTDFSWNAVWKSTVKKQSYGWSFEIKVPFSAVRFPNKSVQEWNINLIRQVRRDREKSFWNPVDPQVFGEITQAGKMTGISNVKSPVRLSFTPYATGYVENAYDETLGAQAWRQRITGGVDLKYGLNDAFTLDMTLIPDFGQTTSDKQVLNLGPFEVMFNENRPFFLEGTDLFSIGNVFYSRRIGAQPYNYSSAYSDLNALTGETVVSNPDLAPLLNGTKVSGRTKTGLGIGVFNSIEGRSQAIIEDSSGNQRIVNTHPVSNYNVFVLSQNLKNNSTVSFVNTNVMREGANRDANVTVLETALFSKDGTYKLSSGLNVSSIFEDADQVYGYRVKAGLAKVSGKWRYGFDYSEESDTYDPNDLGFLYNNNSRDYNASLGWNNFKTGKMFIRKWANFSMYYGELYKPQVFAYTGVEWNVAATTKKFITSGFNGGFKPFGDVNHFESREFGKEVLFGPSFKFGGFFSSDYSKRFALDLRTNMKQFISKAQKGYSFNVSPRLRISDRMSMILRSTWEYIIHDYGYVSSQDENYSDEILLGYRDRQIVTNSAWMEFIFTKRMGIDVQFRHYWQQVEYRYFKELLDEGETVSSDYYPLNAEGASSHNTNYNAFTLDINYRWIFIPGSELRIVYKNNIFNSQNGLVSSYFDTFNSLFDQPRVNSISMKLLVYIDAVYFKRKNQRI